MFPGAVAPFGLVQLSPDTAGGPEPQWNTRGDYTGWDHCPGYYYPDNIMIGFSHTHVQGTGGADLGDILLMPVVEGKNWSWEAGIPEDTALMQIQELGPELRVGFRQSQFQDTVRSSLTIAKTVTPAITAFISIRRSSRGADSDHALRHAPLHAIRNCRPARAAA